MQEEYGILPGQTHSWERVLIDGSIYHYKCVHCKLQKIVFNDVHVEYYDTDDRWINPWSLKVCDSYVVSQVMES